MHKFGISISTIAAVAALVMIAPSAQAAGDFGAAVFFTAKDCTTLAANQDCSVRSQPRIYAEYAGGAGQTVNYYDSNPQGDFVQSQISFGANAFPQIKQSDAAVSNYRVNVNAFAWNGFTNNSENAVEIAYAGNLHIVNSSGAPLGDPTWAGGAGYYSYVAIWDPSLISGIFSAQDVFNSGITGNDCSTPGVLGYGESSGALAGGEQWIHMTTVSCSGSSIMVGAHQEVLAVGFLQTPVNRGGFVDASHTFTVGYDQDKLSSDTIQTLERVMTPDAPAGLGVPEPATWALMISGFGIAGAALRRRRATVAG